MAAAVIVLSIAACGGGDGDATDKTDETPASTSTSTAPTTTRAALDLTAFVGRWFGAPVDLVISDDGSGMLVFPELAADGSDVVAATFVISEVSGATASADVQSNPGNTLLTPGQRVTFTLLSDTELALDLPGGGVFCRPDRSCIPPFE